MPQLNLPYSRHVLAPALRQILVQRAGVFMIRMDVAVDDAETRVGIGAAFQRRRQARSLHGLLQTRIGGERIVHAHALRQQVG